MFSVILHTEMEQGRYSHPKVAIIDPNTPAALGLKAMLQELIPSMDVCTFGSVDELSANNPESFFHYFVALNVLLENRPFFTLRRSKTIVLIPSAAEEARPQGFHSICTFVPERQLVKSLLALEQRAHAGGRNLPPAAGAHRRVLSGREAEVLALIVRGFINKEIADRLNIGLSTVVTHRKNIMEKLGARSVSALTIYAVVNGYVGIDSI